MNKKNLLMTILVLNGIMLIGFNAKVLAAGIFDFNDGTTQGWTLDQMYLTNSQTKFTPVNGYTLSNGTNALFPYTTALLLGTTQNVDFFLQSPDLSANSDWQGISGFSVDVKRLLASGCWGDFPNLFYVQLQVKVIDLSDGNKEKLFAEHNGTSYVFHEIKTYGQLYQLTWNTTWLNNTSKYKVKYVRLRITGPGDASMAECWYSGGWSIDNVTAVGGSGGTTSSVTLTNPNGGQSWAAQTPHYIVWTAQNINNKDFKLEYSTDNGSTYNFITYVTHYGSSGSYLWEIPNAPSTQCLVRISMQSPQISDVSNGVFTITANEKITVDQPNGKENWNVGSPRYIVWHNYLFSGPVKIEYSTNGGSSYSVIENSYSTSTAYAWTIPDAPSNNCLIRVSDASDPTLFDVSDVAFTISSSVTANTNIGNTVQVELGSDIKITYDEVTDAGNTEAQIQPIGPLPPEGMVVIPQSLSNYYEINTSASFTGNIQLEISYSDDGIGPDQETALKLYAYNLLGSQWEDITVSLDVENNIISGQTDHLSAFAIMMSSSSPGTSHIIVTNTQETGPGSLGDAIYLANIQPGFDTISFNIPKSDPGFDAGTGVWTISPTSNLQALSEGGILIDGFSQREFTGEDNNPNGPEIQLNGINAGAYTDGLFITADHAEVLGLIINNFRTGIYMIGVKSGRIAGCYIGTNYAATASEGNVYGITLYDSTQNVVISQYDTCRNVISGNSDWGIGVIDTSYNNAILNNIIGMDRTESNPIPNGSYGGITLARGSFGNGIFGNHISGNAYGVFLHSEVHDNLISQNFIGTDPDGLLTIGNQWDGILLSEGSHNNLIDGNIISNSGKDGIEITGSGTVENMISHNLISSNTYLGINNESGGNLDLEAPTIKEVTVEYVKGSGIPNATIQIFSDPQDEGALFQGETTTDASGNFTWNGTIAGPHKNVTATAIDAQNNTSEFSDSYSVVELPPVLVINQYPGFFEPTPVGHQTMQEAVVSGNNITSSIVLKAPENFRIGIAAGENTEFKDSVIIPLEDHNIEPTLVVILFEPQVAKQFNDSILVKSAGATSIYLKLEAISFGPPVIEAIADQTFCEGEEIEAIPLIFEFFSPNEVEFTGKSNNDAIIPNANINITGEGNFRTIYLTPLTQFGEAEIMVIGSAPGDLKDTVLFVLGIHANPVIHDLDITPESAGNDGKIVVHGTSESEGLQYALNNSAFQQSNEFPGLSKGNYLITIIDNNTCADTMTAMVPKITANKEIERLPIKVFPNPANTVVQLQDQYILQPGYTVEVINMYGEILMKGNLFSEGMMAVGKLPEGVYLLSIKSGTKEYIGKIIINR
jgi:parallel beta-helix repeat protein